MGYTPDLGIICRFGAVSSRRAACNMDDGLEGSIHFPTSRRIAMLVLSRKPGEKVRTSNGVTVTVTNVKGNRVRLGFEAPDDVQIMRSELAQPKQRPPDDLEVGKRGRLTDLEPPNYSNEWALAGSDPPAAGENHFDSSTVSSATRLLPKTEQAATVKIITFTAGQVRLENVLSTELAGLTDELGECHLLLDFTNVEYVTSVELGTLVGLHKKMKASGGRLTLFNLNLQVFEVFLATHLELLIGICR
jgi:carbon storage regulator CsrA